MEPHGFGIIFGELHTNHKSRQMACEVLENYQKSKLPIKRDKYVTARNVSGSFRSKKKEGIQAYQKNIAANCRRHLP